MIAGEPGRRLFDIAPAAIVKLLAVVVLALALLVAAFLALAGSSLLGQARMLSGRIADVQQHVVERLPPGLAAMVKKQQITRDTVERHQRIERRQA